VAELRLDITATDKTAPAFAALAASVDQVAKALGLTREQAEAMRGALSSASKAAGDMSKANAEMSAKTIAAISAAKSALPAAIGAVKGFGDAVKDVGKSSKDVAITVAQQWSSLGGQIGQAFGPLVGLVGSALGAVAGAAATFIPAIRELRDEVRALAEESARQDKEMAKQKAYVDYMRQRKRETEAETLTEAQLMEKRAKADNDLNVKALAFYDRILNERKKKTEEALAQEIADAKAAEEKKRDDAVKAARETRRGQEAALAKRGEGLLDFFNTQTAMGGDTGGLKSALEKIAPALDSIASRDYTGYEVI